MTPSERLTDKYLFIVARREDRIAGLKVAAICICSFLSLLILGLCVLV